MSTPTNPPGRDNTENLYVIDAESGAEMARLMVQDRLVTKSMGGLFPERTEDLADIQNILDIGCGPGGWVLDVAYKYPKKQVMGIDISRVMVEYARAQAWSQGLDNASFRVMDALKPFTFPDGSFDLINARAIVGFMPKTAWPTFLKECRRITRPGGTIRLSEGEWGITNSAACEKLIGMCTRALQLAGRSFSPDGRHIGIMPMLGRFLREAGCQNVQQRAYASVYVTENEEYASFYEDFMAAFNLLQPFLVKMGVTTEEEVEPLYQQALAEMMLPDFCVVSNLVTAWGEN